MLCDVKILLSRATCDIYPVRQQAYDILAITVSRTGLAFCVL